MHFLDATKQGQVFVPKQRPLPADPGLKDGTKEQPQAQASQAQANQGQATKQQAAHSNLSYPSTELEQHTTAKWEKDKRSPVIDPLSTEVTKPNHPGREKPHSQSNLFPSGTAVVHPGNQGDTNQTQNARPITQTPTVTVFPQMPPVQPPPSYPTTYVKGTKELPNALQGRYQQTAMGKMKEQVPLTPVNVAIIECKVLERSVQVAHAFFFEVAKSLNLKPSFYFIRGENPDELVTNLIKEAASRSFSFVVLLVEKHVLHQISARREDILSYADLVAETEANAGEQFSQQYCHYFPGF